MIVNTNGLMLIGYVGQCWISDQNGEYHVVRMRVMREATKQEYLNWCKQHNSVEFKGPLGKYFYEVHTD